MGKSSSQVVAYRYYAKFAAFIGNRIEKLIGINFDNRKWVIHDPLKHPPNLLPVLEGNLFGENEGGVSGNVDIHFGYPNQEPNTEYQKYFPLVSGYPYQSYLVFRGLTSTNPFTGKQTTAPGFYLGNSGYMKEMLLWVKRTRVRNDGREQWYKDREDGAIVCEIGTKRLIRSSVNVIDIPKLIINYDAKSYTSYSGMDNDLTSSGFQYLGSDSLLQKFDPSTRVAGYTVELANTEENKGRDVIDTTFRIPSAPLPFLKLRVTFKSYGHTSFSIDGSILSKKLLSKTTTSSPTYEPYTNTVEYEVVVDLKNSGATFIANTTEAELKPNGSLRSENSITVVAIEFLSTAYGDVSGESPDINPIHKIREILTDDTAMGKPESDVSDANFMKAADRIFDEGLGVSWAIDEKSCIDAIEELCYHIEAGIRVNRQTGLYEMVLFRDDWFAENEIHTIAENKIKDLSLEVMNSDDIVNQLNVTYYDRERIKNSTFSVYENGSILTMGHANAESVEFPYFMNTRNAEIVANWKLKQFSTPAWSGSFSTGWREARKWNRYDLIRLPWSKKWNGTILVRIMKINLGNGSDNTVTIDFEEVIPYSGEMNTSIIFDDPVESAPQPPQPSINAIFEAPYYLTVLRAGQTNADLELSNNPDIGYIAAIAAKPQNNSLNALLYTDGGVGEFEQASRLDYCDILQLGQPITETTSSFVVTGSLTQTANSNNLILLNDEWMGFVSFDDEAKVLVVKRGVLDTIPKKHNSGNLFVFDLPDVAFDSTQYAQSEIVEAQVLTTTPSGIQDLSETGEPVEIQARAIRPYPPANVKINGEYWPDEIETDLIVTWVDRNRLQQTGGETLGWFDASVTLEPNTQTILTIVEFDMDDAVLATHNINVVGVKSYFFEKAQMQAGTRYIHINLKTMRDGYACLSEFDHSVRIFKLEPPANVTFEVIEL